MGNINITVPDVKNIVGSSAPLAKEMVPIINKYADQFGVNTVERMSAFLGQLAVESLFKYRGEIWGPTKAQLGYEGRKDLGNIQPGDGSKFRGYGGIQITGRGNVQAFSDWLDKQEIEHPDFLANPSLLGQAPWWVLGAFWYWSTWGLNRLADALTIENVRDQVLGSGKSKPTSKVRPITKKVNGGYNHLAERITATERALRRLHPDLDAEKRPKPLPVDSAAGKPAMQIARLDAMLPKVDPGLLAPKGSLANTIFNVGGPSFKATRGNPVDPTVKTVQEILFAKGYKMVGRNDGRYGQNTLDAIVAARRDLGLPLIDDTDEDGMIQATEAITPDFLAAITIAPPREVDPQRAALPTKEIASIVPEVAQARLGKLTSIVGAGAAGLPAIGGFVWDQVQKFPDLRAQIDPILSALSLSIPNWAWFGILFGVMVTTYLLTRRSERAAVQAYRSGERVAQN